MRVVRHLDYELSCGAMAIDHGRYKPTLTVAKERWPKRPRAIEVAVGEHLSAEAAIEAAFRVGVEWVQNYG